MGWLFVLSAVVFASFALAWVHFVCKLISDGQPASRGELKRYDCPWTRFDQNTASEFESASAHPLDPHQPAQSRQELKCIGDIYKLEKTPGANAHLQRQDAA